MAYYYNVLSVCLSEVSEEYALEYLNGFDFSESELSDQEIGHARYVATSDDGCTEMYYDYAADYYFFTDVTGESEDDGQPDWHQEWADFGEEY